MAQPSVRSATRKRLQRRARGAWGPLARPTAERPDPHSQQAATRGPLHFYMAYGRWPMVAPGG
eukprot:2188161-Prymnesium_polylepis.1